jgi:hypothetical protein
MRTNNQPHQEQNASSFALNRLSEAASKREQSLVHSCQQNEGRDSEIGICLKLCQIRIKSQPASSFLFSKNAILLIKITSKRISIEADDSSSHFCCILVFSTLARTQQNFLFPITHPRRTTHNSRDEFCFLAAFFHFFFFFLDRRIFFLFFEKAPTTKAQPLRGLPLQSPIRAIEIIFNSLFPQWFYFAWHITPPLSSQRT